MNNWRDTSEVVAGAAISHQYNPIPEEEVLRIPLNQLRPEAFAPPYDRMIKDMQAGAIVEDVVKTQIASYQASLSAVRNLNGSSQGVDWVLMLEKSSAQYRGGEELERMAKKLKRGETVDLTKLNEVAAKIDADESVAAYTPLSEVSREKPAFIETGFMPIDHHLGGIPSTGMTTVLGTPGIGKTTFAIGLARCFANYHSDKIVAFHTMEMLGEEISKRFDELGKLPKNVQERILIRDISESADKVLAKAAATENLGLIIVDFAEYLVRGEVTEGAMTYAFKALSEGSKNLRVPLILLAQVNRNYQGGVPRPHHVYYTGAAEKLSWMFLSLYNPNINKNFTDDPDKDKLLVKPNEAAIVCLKSRGGFRVHPKESPGGMVVQWDGKRGWRPDQPGKWRKIQ